MTNSNGKNNNLAYHSKSEFNSQLTPDNSDELMNNSKSTFSKEHSNFDPLLQKIINDSQATPDTVNTILQTLTLFQEQAIGVDETISIIAKDAPKSVSKTMILKYIMSLKSTNTSLFLKIHQHLGQSDSYKNFISLINLYNQSKLTISELLDSSFQYLGNNPTLWDQFLIHIDLPTHHIHSNPSYSVINKKYFCSAPFEALQSEFNVREKNPSEEILFDIEDRRYKLTQLTQLTQRLIQDLHQTPPVLRSIYNNVFSEIFGDDYEDIISGIKHSPNLFLKPVLERFNIQLKKWKTDRRRWERVWKYQERHHNFKSKDYRSIQNKRMYTKSLTQGTLTNQFYSSYLDTNFESSNSFLILNPAPGLPPSNALPSHPNSSFHEDIGALVFYTIQKDHNLKVVTKTRISSFYQSLIRKIFDCNCFTLVDHEGTTPEYELQQASTSQVENQSTNQTSQQEDLANSPILIGDVLTLNFFQLYDYISHYLTCVRNDLALSSQNDPPVDLSVIGAYNYCFNALKQRRSNKITQIEFEELIRPVAALNTHLLIKIDEAVAALVRQLVKIYNTSQSIYLIELFLCQPNRYQWSHFTQYCSKATDNHNEDRFLVIPFGNYTRLQYSLLKMDSLDVLNEFINHKTNGGNQTSGNGLNSICQRSSICFDTFKIFSPHSK